MALKPGSPNYKFVPINQRHNLGRLMIIIQMRQLNQQSKVPIKYETISMRNNRNKKYFLQDLVRIAFAVCATKPTIVDLIVSVFAHRVCATNYYSEGCS